MNWLMVMLPFKEIMIIKNAKILLEGNPYILTQVLVILVKI